MKKIYIIIAIVALLSIACSKDSLKLQNPNEPGLENLRTEEGIQKFALGVYAPMKGGVNYYAWFALTLHNLMGDATTAVALNFGFCYSNQIFSITRPDGSVIKSSLLGGKTQGAVLKQLNIRENGNENAFNNE